MIRSQNMPCETVSKRVGSLNGSALKTPDQVFISRYEDEFVTYDH